MVLPTALRNQPMVHENTLVADAQILLDQNTESPPTAAPTPTPCLYPMVIIPPSRPKCREVLSLREVKGRQAKIRRTSNGGCQVVRVLIDSIQTQARAVRLDHSLLNPPYLNHNLLLKADILWSNQTMLVSAMPGRHNQRNQPLFPAAGRQLFLVLLPRSG